MAQCEACSEPLVLEIEPDEELDQQQIETVPDDLELPCGCHFHWQCLLDQASDIALTLKCPSCQSYLPTNQPGPSTTNAFRSAPSGPRILTKYVNEGGPSELDLLPVITEEAYLETNPEAQPARAYHTMCSEGDVEGIVELLQNARNDLGGDSGKLAQLLRYQDPLSDMRSGLHLAITKSQEGVVWLLLWLASTLPTDSFPLVARERAESMHLGRLNTNAADDIRALPNAAGKTAEDLARTMPRVWGQLLDAGLLRA